MTGLRSHLGFSRGIAALAPVLACAAALAQNGAQPGTSTTQSGPQHGDTSAQAKPAGAKAANPARETSKVSDLNPANAGRAVLVPVATNTQDASMLSRSLQARAIDLRAPMRFDRVFALRGAAPANMHGGTMLNFGGSNIVASSMPLDTTGTEWFARVDGGLMAIFPKSVYDETRDGLTARAPAGTIFVIGHPPAQFVEAKVARPRVEEPLPESFTPLRPTAQGAVRSANRSVFVTAKSADPERTEETREATGVRSEGAARTRAMRSAPGNAAASAAGTILGDELYRTRRVRGLLLKAAADAKRDEARAHEERKTPADKSAGESEDR